MVWKKLLLILPFLIWAREGNAGILGCVSWLSRFTQILRLSPRPRPGVIATIRFQNIRVEFGDADTFDRILIEGKKDYPLFQGRVSRIPLGLTDVSPVWGDLKQPCAITVPPAVSHRVTGYSYESSEEDEFEIPLTFTTDEGILVIDRVPGGRASENYGLLPYAKLKYTFMLVPSNLTEVSQVNFRSLGRPPLRRLAPRPRAPFQASSLLVSVNEGQTSHLRLADEEVLAHMEWRPPQRSQLLEFPEWEESIRPEAKPGWRRHTWILKGGTDKNFAAPNEKFVLYRYGQAAKGIAQADWSHFESSIETDDRITLYPFGSQTGEGPPPIVIDITDF